MSFSWKWESIFVIARQQSNEAISSSNVEKAYRNLSLRATVGSVAIPIHNVGQASRLSLSNKIKNKYKGFQFIEPLIKQYVQAQFAKL